MIEIVRKAIFCYIAKTYYFYFYGANNFITRQAPDGYHGVGYIPQGAIGLKVTLLETSCKIASAIVVAAKA